jgi:hypothetical protein
MNDQHRQALLADCINVERKRHRALRACPDCGPIHFLCEDYLRATYVTHCVAMATVVVEA